jgi:DNA-binding response OmpR family regulator
MKILLVEDDRRVAARLIEVLQDDGYEVTWCQSAREARLLVANHFDAFVFDVDLGHGPTGLDLAMEVRSAHPSAPIVVWSGNDHSCATAALGATFVLKGFSACDDVLAAIATFMEAG